MKKSIIFYLILIFALILSSAFGADYDADKKVNQLDQPLAAIGLATKVVVADPSDTDKLAVEEVSTILAIDVTVAAGAPDADRDINHASGPYDLGHHWFNTATGIWYVLRDSTDGAAVWDPINAVPGAYDESTWNANVHSPTKDAVRDKIETLQTQAAMATDVPTNEADPIVGAITGVVVADGAGNISAASNLADVAYEPAADMATDVPANEADPIVGAITGLPKADGAGNISAASAGTDYTSPASTEAFTNKTFDSGATGNVIRGFKYITLYEPQVYGAAVTKQTTVTARSNDQALFADDAETDNFVEYILEVPRDIDTTVDLVAWFKFILSGEDTADHDYVIAMISIDDSADNGTAVGNAISLDYTADASGASGDSETAGGNALTDWKANVTAGSKWVIRITRDGDDGTNDASTVDSISGPLTIRYGYTQ